MDRSERFESHFPDSSQEHTSQREAQVRRRVEEVAQETKRFLAGDPELLEELEKERAQLEQYVQEKITAAVVETDRLVRDTEKKLEYGLAEADVGQKERGKIQKELEISKLFFQQLRRKFFKLMPWLLPAVFVAKIGMNRLNPEQPSGSVSNRVVATRQLERDGIDDAQRSIYIPGVSELVYRVITPAGYQSLWDAVRQAPENLVTGREESKVIMKDGAVETIRKSQWAERNDAWRIYLGLPQEHKTFGISNYKPEKSDTDKYYYRINNWLETFSTHFRDQEKPPIQQIVEFIKLRTQFKDDATWKKHLEDHGLEENFGTGLLESRVKGENSVVAVDIKLVKNQTGGRAKWREVHGIMGHFTLSVGEDAKGPYISYYDKWNLEHAPVEGKEGFIGKAFEIYNRIHFDPATYEAVD